MDMIDKRNLQDKIARSIIKRRNVVYSQEAYTGPVTMAPWPMQEMPAAPAAQAPAPVSEAPVDPELAKAQEIIERLARESEEEEAAKRAQIQQAVEDQEAISRILNEKNQENQRHIEAARKK